MPISQDEIIERTAAAVGAKPIRDAAYPYVGPKCSSGNSNKRTSSRSIDGPALETPEYVL